MRELKMRDALDAYCRMITAPLPGSKPLREFRTQPLLGAVTQ